MDDNDHGFSENPTDENELSAEQIAKGIAAYNRRMNEDHRRGEDEKMQWPDWCEAIPVLHFGSRSIMKKLGIDRPSGKTYASEFSRWLREHGGREASKKGKTERSYAIRCAPLVNEINEWRATLDEKKLARKNGPQANLRGYEQRRESPGESKPRHNGFEGLDHGEIAATIANWLDGNQDSIRAVVQQLLLHIDGADEMIVIPRGSSPKFIRESLLGAGLTEANLHAIASVTPGKKQRRPSFRVRLMAEDILLRRSSCEAWARD